MSNRVTFRLGPGKDVTAPKVLVQVWGSYHALRESENEGGKKIGGQSTRTVYVGSEVGIL